MHVASVHDDHTGDVGTATATNSPVVEQIIEAATGAVAEHGLDGLSMEDIALRAGCARATVYRRIGGKEALRDAVVREAVARITAAIAMAVEHPSDEDRVVSVMVASLDTIRADPVCAALLTGSAAAVTVNSPLITEYNAMVAELSGLDPGDAVGSELIARATLALLAWPAVDRDSELAIIRRHTSLVDRPNDIRRPAIERRNQATMTSPRRGAHA